MNHQNQTQLLWVAGIGNALELYDYVLYAAMLPHLMPVFFPHAEWGQLLGFLSFALTFLIAPLGAWGWGKYAKRYGTSGVLKKSMLWMAFPSLGIALLPTYQHIGAWAPCLLMALRLFQGISVSGEAMGGKLFAMESLPHNQQTWASGFLSACGALGVGLAMLMGALMSNCSIEGAWRFPFILGSILFFVARWVRQLPNRITPTSTEPANGLLEISRKNPYASAFVCFLGAHLGITSYTLHAFINPYCMRFNITETHVYLLSLSGLCITATAALITGKLCVSRSSLYKTLLFCFLGSTFLSFPCFWLCQSGNIVLAALGYGLLACLLGIYATTSAVMMYAVFQKEDRTAGVLFYYALGCSIFGGAIPLVLEALLQLHSHCPGLFLSLLGLASTGLFCQLYRHVRLH